VAASYALSSLLCSESGVLRATRDHQRQPTTPDPVSGSDRTRLSVNDIQAVSLEIVEAARYSLIIGEA